MPFVSEATLDDLVEELTREAASERPGWRSVVTPNVDHVVHYDRHEQDAAVARASFLVLPDGMPVVWSSRLLGRPLRNRLAGSDLFPVLWPRLAADATPVVVVAPSDAVVDGLVAEHPGTRGVVPPFFPVDDDAAVAAVVDEIVAAADEVSARFVFVMLSMAKCHLLAHHLRLRWAGRIEPQPIVVLAGASAEFHLGLVERAPAWMRRWSLEWLHRLALDPRRMARRYLVDDPYFAVLIWREWRSGRRRR